MRVVRLILEVIAFVAAFVATLGAAALNADLMGIAGIVAALAAMGHGLFSKLIGDEDLPSVEVDNGRLVL